LGRTADHRHRGHLLAFGTKLSSNFSAVITAIKVAVVLLVVIVGSFYIKTANYTPFIPPPTPGDTAGTGVDQSLFSLLTGAAGSHYGLYGLLAGASIVLRVHRVRRRRHHRRGDQGTAARRRQGHPGVTGRRHRALRRGVDRALRHGALHRPQDRTGRQTRQPGDRVRRQRVHWAATVISIGALAGLTTVVMVLVLGQTRVLFAMSRDGLLPRPLAKTGPHGTPVRITVLVAVLVAVSASVFPIDKLEEMVNVGTLFAFILVSAGVIVLRRSRPDLERGFTVPGVPWLPVASIIACLWLMLNLTALTWIRFLIWMVLGVGVYWLYGRRHSRFATDQPATPRRCTGRYGPPAAATAPSTGCRAG
jgi:APA family basic amino acid/polyamine antiporter